MKCIPLVLATLFWQPGGALVPAAPCQARLALHWHDQLLTVTGHCHSQLDQPARYRYQLVVVRRGAGGRVQNSQGGEFALPPRQDAVLAEVRLNAGAADGYEARLLVFDLNGRPVAQDSARQAFSQP